MNLPMLKPVVSFHELLQVPAHEFIVVLYQQLLERTPSLEEQAYHLAKLNRGYSKKQLILMIYYSPECRQRFADKQLLGGRWLAQFHRVASHYRLLGKLLAKTLYTIDVFTGVAKERAYQFATEWQLHVLRQQQQQQQQLRYEVLMLQQDVQRRVDLFLYELQQTLPQTTEVQSLREQVQYARQQLVDHS